MALVLGTAALTLLGCTGSDNDNNASVSENSMQGDTQKTAGSAASREPYAVKTVLKEYTTADPNRGVVAYGRYTELIVEDGAPDTLKREAAKCNKRAEESVKMRADAAAADTLGEDTLNNETGNDDAAPLDAQIDEADLEYVKFAYIVTVTRADDTAFGFLETELETGISTKRGVMNASEYASRFYGHTFETETGEEIQLSDIVDDEKKLQPALQEALYLRYGIRDLARTEPSDYAWTADALGISFCFHSEAVSNEKRTEAEDYSGTAVMVSIPYTALDGKKSAFLADVPDEYIARMECETVYDLPHGDMSVMITEKDGDVVLRRMPDQGQTEDLIIEYADKDSAYYIIRSGNGFYLFRERIGYQEGFFYDFSRPDGGFGRFAYNTAQYFDSYLREIGLAFAYNPRCVHMCEKKRSFGKASYDASSFIPNGHYSFPDQSDGRYKLFMLIDDSLSIDSYNLACRLLEDFTAVKLDEKGNEAGEITIKAGRAMTFETVSGEGKLYLAPPERSNSNREFIYECRLSDGTRVRFVSAYESTIFTNGAYMNRFTEPVSLWEAQFDIEPEAKEAFTVNIGGKEYPVIPDYSQKDHVGEVIDFGDDIWWQAEGYVGKYVITEKDKEEMKEEYFTQDAVSHTEGTAVLEISEDGHAVLDYFGVLFEGDLPKERRYHTDFVIRMDSPEQNRSFQVSLREGEYHSVPEKIELYSEGLPATNEPSKVPPLSVYLTKV